MKNAAFKDFFKNNWLIMLIAAQPILDMIAFWNQNSVATAAGYIRLAIMLIMPLYLVLTLKRKRGFIISMAVIGAIGILHSLNCVRLGYINPFFDLSYYAKVIQTPVITICLMALIRDEDTKRQAVKGIYLAAGIFAAGILIALATGTWNSTYGAGVGLSGWVIDDNRCANSIITVTLAVFSVCAASMSDKKYLQLGIPAIVTFFLIANGTKACYLGLFAVLLGFSFFMILRRFVTRDKIKPFFVTALLVLAVISALIYPVSPRAKIDASQGDAKSEAQQRFESALTENGYTDIESMNLEDKMNDPVLKNIYFEYYVSVFGAMSDIYDRFGMDRVFEKYNMTSDINVLIDTRVIKRNYASLIWDDCDLITRLVGFESTEMVKNGMYDMENDYPALFYYYGYLGFGLYCLFLLYFIYLIVRRLFKDFKGSFTIENFTLLLCLMLQLGLAEFSGALIRRPNVSIYLSIVLALIYYNTAVLPAGRVEEEQGK